MDILEQISVWVFFLLAIQTTNGTSNKLLECCKKKETKIFLIGKKRDDFGLV